MLRSYGRSVTSAATFGSHALADQAPGPAVEHLQLEVPGQHDLGAAVAVEIVNLERRVVGEQPVLRVRPSQLPQHAAVEGHGRQAADVIERVAADLGHVLREQHLRRAVAIEVTEAYVASGAEARGVELPPHRWLWVLGPQTGEIAIPALHALAQISGFGGGGGYSEGPETRGPVRREARDPFGQLAIAHVDERPAVHRCAEPIPLDGRLEPIPGLRVVRERRDRHLSPCRHAELLVERQPGGQPQPRAALERQPVVMAGRAVTHHQPRLLLQRKGLHRHFDTVVAPLRIAGHEERDDAVRFEVDGVLFQVRAVGLVARGPRVEVHDRVAPRTGRHSAMLEVVVLLDGAVQQADRRREHPGRKAREVVLEQLDVVDRPGALDGTPRQKQRRSGQEPFELHRCHVTSLESLITNH